jgi:hypothetical protein
LLGLQCIDRSLEGQDISEKLSKLSQRRQRQTFALADPLGSALVDFMGNFQLTHNEQLVHAIFMLKKR